MKKKYLLILTGLLFPAFNTSALPTWKWVNPLPSPSAVFDFCFPDSMNGWVTAGSGELYHTVDGGSHWVRNKLPMTGEIRELSFINSSTGWCLLYPREEIDSAYDPWTFERKNVLLFTENAGVDWLVFQTPDSGTGGMFFVSKNIGWIGGSSYRTVNGGKTWLPAWTLPQNDGPLMGYYYTDSLHGFLGFNFGNFFKTSDAGYTWSSITVPTDCCMNNITFFGQKYGWGCKLSYVMTTKDSGKTWSAVSTPLTNVARSTEFQDITFIDSVNGWVCDASTSRYLLRTTDGLTWRIVSNMPYSFGKMRFTSKAKAWGGAFRGRYISPGTLYKSIDSGLIWNDYISYSSRDTLEDVCVLENGKLWTVGSQGSILFSPDSGRTWQRQNSGTTEHLFSLNFKNDKWGFASGNNGIVLSTISGGSSWTNTNCPTYYRIRSVFFNGTTVWIAGDTGSLYRSDDSGKTWKNYCIQSSICFQKIIFPSKDTGFAFSTKCAFYKTIDGGLSWIRDSVNAGISGSFGDCCFFDPYTCYLSCDGNLLASPNGGKNWTIVITQKKLPYNNSRSYPADTITRIIFKNPDTGFVLVNHGLPFFTNNGCRSWYAQFGQINHPSGFKSITFTKNYGIGCAVGINGTIACLSDDTPLLVATHDRVCPLAQQIPVRLRFNNQQNRLMFPSDCKGPFRILVTNINGVIVLDYLINKGSASIPLPIPPGVYLVKLKGDHMILTDRFIKLH